MKVSWGPIIPNIWKVIKFMFQTTNQFIMYIYIYYHDNIILSYILNYINILDTIWLWLTVCHGKIHHAIKNGKPSISIRAIYPHVFTISTGHIGTQWITTATWNPRGHHRPCPVEVPYLEERNARSQALGKHNGRIQKKKQQNGRKKPWKSLQSHGFMNLLDNSIQILIISVQHSSRKVMTDIVWTLDAKGVSVVLNHRLIRMAAKFCSSRWFIPWNQPMFYSLSWESQ